MRFFFDYTTTGQSLSDYQGDEFPNAEAALNFAEATVQTLKNNLNGDWIGWSVEVRNAEGTKYISLPVMPGRLAPTSANVESDRSAADTSSLLIVEDDLVHSSIIFYIASKLGFTAATVRSYEAACEVLGVRQFDCITLDLGLGQQVGVDILHYLATIRCCAQIIVISQSDKDICNDMVELGRALDLNVCEAVPKPIDLGALREVFVRIQTQSSSRQPISNPI